MMKTALIISTYNWTEALELCLKSVQIQSILPDELIIADDGSKSDTKIVIDNFSKITNIQVKHIWQPDKGFRLSEIRNKAIKASNSEYLIFIDGDIILHPRFVQDHIENCKKDSFIAGSRVLISQKESQQRIKNGKVKFSFLPFSSKNRFNGVRSDFLSGLFSKSDKGIFNVRGCNMSFWKKDLIEVNGFDEQFLGWGREDSDIVLRLQNAGKTKFKLKFAAIQYHLFHATNDQNRLSKNTELLNETIKRKRIKAKIGLSQ